MRRGYWTSIAPSAWARRATTDRIFSSRFGWSQPARPSSDCDRPVHGGKPIPRECGAAETPLHRETTPPLSIDVDIITQAKPEHLAATLEALAKLAPLTASEHDAPRD